MWQDGKGKLDSTLRRPGLILIMKIVESGWGSIIGNGLLCNLVGKTARCSRILGFWNKDEEEGC